MKTLTIDFDLYKKELNAELMRGLINGLNWCKWAVQQKNRGVAHEEILASCDDNQQKQFVDELFNERKTTV